MPTTLDGKKGKWSSKTQIRSGKVDPVQFKRALNQGDLLLVKKKWFASSFSPLRHRTLNNKRIPLPSKTVHSPNNSGRVSFRLTNSHVIHSASRNHAWKARMLCVINGLAIKHRKIWGKLFLFHYIKSM